MKKENLIGKEVIIIANTGNHAYPIGTKVFLRSGSNAGGFAAYSEGYGGYTVRRHEFKLSPSSLESLREDEKNLTRQLEDVKARIEYLTATGKTEVCDNEFTAYRVLLSLEKKNTTLVEKAAEIASFFED